MAKRKRLSPATMHADGPLETKAAFAPPSSPAASRAPIADVARDAAAQAALQELSETVTRARAEGRIVLSLRLEDITLDHLVRDRVAVDEGEMATLKASLRARGQQTPIEVMALEGERYGLISGWRRCKALAALYAETADPRFGVVHALLRQPDDAADAYLAMVEENEIRVGLSYFERARIAAKSVEQGVFATPQDALRQLYQSASRSKRSKIGSFMRVVSALDGHLQFPEAIGERFGLSLSKALEEEPALVRRLRRALAAKRATSAEEEQAVLAQKMASSKGEGETDRGRAKQSNQSLTNGLVSDASQLPPNVDVIHNADGQFSLSGAGVTPALRKALMKVLKTYRPKD